jgi:glycosyltransferase involved in cell wall biosynthesis
MITFVHGGELLSYSKNPLKHFLKRISHKKILKSLSRSRFNFFISDFTFKLYQQLGGVADYSRDFVFHNCIDTSQSEFINKDLEGEISLCSFVRDVPHKNIKGIIETFNLIKSKHPHKVTLYITSDCEGENIVNISNCDNEKRENILKTSHLNLLMSLDHSHRGNIEGFGLTVLEAGKYGVPTIGLSTGGLVESIHHLSTGLLADQSCDLYADIKNYYSRMSHNVYQHTIQSHSLDKLEKLFRNFL